MHGEQAYDDDHDKEAALFDNLGRLLAEVKAFARCLLLSMHLSLLWSALICSLL